MWYSHRAWPIVADVHARAEALEPRAAPAHRNRLGRPVADHQRPLVLGLGECVHCGLGAHGDEGQVGNPFDQRPYQDIKTTSMIRGVKHHRGAKQRGRNAAVSFLPTGGRSYSAAALSAPKISSTFSVAHVDSIFR